MFLDTVNIRQCVALQLNFLDISPVNIETHPMLIRVEFNKC
ncbi:hypothetical protein WP8S18E02_25800 [Aeromonas hydrophila]|nr:hypothetical protein AO056_00989 [Aeromonas hydrophila]BBT62783.1 hypothetical protein WP8S18E02_25800 [Aeromonas hydrophila]